ncbi:hypothetical protein BGZ81_004048 [Podila clonocystis]|nr:hypothetical protein BGZ81_004048 [Podila clonocystis]
MSSTQDHLPESNLAIVSSSSAIVAASVAQSTLGCQSKSGTFSRTQQKLWLQRENLYTADEDEMAHRGRIQKEMDRINREYKCVRMGQDPSIESMLRCLAQAGTAPTGTAGE